MEWSCDIGICRVGLKSGSQRIWKPRSSGMNVATERLSRRVTCLSLSRTSLLRVKISTSRCGRMLGGVSIFRLFSLLACWWLTQHKWLGLNVQYDDICFDITVCSHLYSEPRVPGNCLVCSSSICK